MPPLDAAWQQKLDARRAHAAAYGWLPLPSDASGLGAWVSSQSKKAAEAGRPLGKRITPLRVAALEGVPGWAWEVNLEAIWEEKLNALRVYVGVHRRLPPQRDSSGLSKWLHNQRQAKKAPAMGRKYKCKMTPARAAALEAVPGWTWDTRRRAAAPAAPPAKRAKKARQ
jgi:hypothetical protein